MNSKLNFLYCIISIIGSSFYNFISFSGMLSRLLWQLIASISHYIILRSAVLWAINWCGSGLLPLFLLSGSCVGVILLLQAHYALQQIGVYDSIGSTVTLALMRELAPVLGSILFSATSGIQLCTKLATMKMTDQLDAIETMGLNPVTISCTPFFIASIISLPLLTAIFCTSGVIAAAITSRYLLGLPFWIFWDKIYSTVNITDITDKLLLKSLIFAVWIVIIAVACGFNADKSPTAVAVANSRTLHYATYGIFVLDIVFAIY